MTDRPIRTLPRIDDVDALRGFALAGIFLVNITFMASGYPANLVVDPAHDTAATRAAHLVSAVLVDMKFYLLFSFLFGYSFTLQMTSAARAGAAFEPRMLRRIAGLFAFGALHLVFLYGGDILITYALACLVLFWMRDASDRTALRVAAGTYGIVVAATLVVGLTLDVGAWLPSGTQALADAHRETVALQGGWSEVIGVHLAGLPLFVAQAVTLQGPTAFAMFLLGFVAGRRRLLAEVRGDETVLRRIQLVGFPVGLTGALLYALGGGNGQILAVAASIATAPFLTAAYIATLLRMMHAPRTHRLRTALAPAGRMALTNYLAQSVIGLLLFTGIGLGAAGKVSPVGLSAIALTVFAFQLLVSAAWLRRFRYGPAEWVLRWTTIGRRPSLRGTDSRSPEVDGHRSTRRPMSPEP